MSVTVAQFYVEINPDQLFTHIDQMREKLNAQLDGWGYPAEGREIVVRPAEDHDHDPDCEHDHQAGITLAVTYPEDGPARERMLDMADALEEQARDIREKWGAA